MNRSTSSTISAFFLFAFFSALLPMDFPQKKSWKEDTTQEALERLQLTGGIWSAIRSDTLKFCLPLLPGECKNILLKTNKALNILLSRENPQPFMFCKHLCTNTLEKIYIGTHVVRLPHIRYTFDDVDFLLFELIKKNDQDSFAVFKATSLYDKFSKDIRRSADKWLQLAVFCGSPKLIESLSSIYKGARAEMCSQPGSFMKEADYFAEWFNLSKPNKKLSTGALIIFYHEALNEKHKYNQQNYHDCLRQILSAKDLTKLGISLPQEENKKNTKKPKKGTKKYYFF